MQILKTSGMKNNLKYKFTVFSEADIVFRNILIMIRAPTSICMTM